MRSVAKMDCIQPDGHAILVACFWRALKIYVNVRRNGPARLMIRTPPGTKFWMRMCIFMPSYVTHTLFGQSVLKSLLAAKEDAAARIIQDNPAAFQWGAQGPDILFFRNGFKRAPNPLGDYGARMHKTKNALLLEAMREYLSQNGGNGAAAAYVSGFLCHYCLDRAVHPYIYFMQEKMRDRYHSSLPYGIHMKLETDLDTAMYLRQAGGNIRAYRMDPQLIEAKSQLKAIGELQAHVISKVYQGDFQPEDIEACIVNAFKKERFMFDPTYVKSWLFCKLLDLIRNERNAQSANCRPKRVNYDILNLGRQEWHNFRVKGAARHESVPELFDAAVQAAAALIGQMWQAAAEDRPLGLDDDIPTFDDGNPAAFGLEV